MRTLRQQRTNAGFTLVEIAIVAAIISIMVAFAVPQFSQWNATQRVRSAGRSLIMSTIIGGIGAIIGWQILSITPSLTIYTLIILIAGLVMGPQIFKGNAMVIAPAFVALLEGIRELVIPIEASGAGLL